MIDFSNVKILTFDCYGTLIDWEKGIISALQPYFQRNNILVDDESILELYSKFESEIEKWRYMKYKIVLQQVVHRFNEHFNIKKEKRNGNCLLESFSSWEPFEDTVWSLKRLKNRFKIAIISNVDKDLFEITSRKLGVSFDYVIVAEDVGCYKPSKEIFEFALKKIGYPKENIVHIAQSLYHDIRPASELGIKTIWVNRRKGKKGTGATPYVNVVPDIEVPDLKKFVELIEKATVFKQTGKE